MLGELVGDQSLERFRQEYEKLHRALKKSHESEKRLIKKCKELNAEVRRPPIQCGSARSSRSRAPGAGGGRRATARGSPAAVTRVSPAGQPQLAGRIYLDHPPRRTALHRAQHSPQP